MGVRACAVNLWEVEAAKMETIGGRGRQAGCGSKATGLILLLPRATASSYCSYLKSYGLVLLLLTQELRPAFILLLLWRYGQLLPLIYATGLLLLLLLESYMACVQARGLE